MKTSELAELFLVQLFDLANQEGFDKFQSLDPLAQKLGVRDRARVLSVSTLLEDRGLVRTANTFGGSNAVITAEGADLVEQGGETGCIEKYRNTPEDFPVSTEKRATSRPESSAKGSEERNSSSRKITDLATTLLQAQLDERHEKFPYELSQIVSEAGMTGNVHSSGLANEMERAARKEMRLRGQMIGDTLERVIIVHQIGEELDHEIQEWAKSRLALEKQDIEKHLNSPLVMKIRQKFTDIYETFETVLGKLAGETVMAWLYSRVDGSVPGVAIWLLVRRCL